MSVALTPSSSLGFNRPFTQHVKRSLAITNNNAQPVAFKVKTTAPKLYCVRPNSGRVEPGETVEVQVMLQAMKEDPPLSTKCKDKFLIQSTFISPEKESLPLQDIWNTPESPEEVHSQKIRVVYLPPEGQTVPEEDEGVSSLAVQPPESRYDTVRGAPANGHAQDVSADEGVTLPHEEEEHHDAPASPPANVTRMESQRSEPPAPQVVSAPEEDVNLVQVDVHPPPPPAPAPAPTEDPSAELEQQLKAAVAEIERLRNIISSMPDPSTEPSTFTSTETELRRRRRPLSDDGTSTWDGETDVGTFVEEAVAPPEGVPLQVVIIIALGVFVTTYLFF